MLVETPNFVTHPAVRELPPFRSHPTDNIIRMTVSKLKETIWFRVTAWGKTAEICNQYLRKGMRVFIEGRLRPDTNGSPRVFQRADGTTGSSYEVVASTVKFISPKPEGEAASGEEFETAPTTTEEDIPF